MAKKCDRHRGNVPSAYNAGFASWADTGREKVGKVVCGYMCVSLPGVHACCQLSCLSVGRDQQLCILFAGLCCLSAGRDTASISDKKCDRPRGEGAPRVKPTVCILGAEAKALSADKRFPCKRVVLRWFFYPFGSTKSSSLRRVWTMRGQKLRRF